MRIENSDLRLELEASKSGGGMTEKFAFLAVSVAQGHIARKFGECTAANRADFLSDFQCRLVGKWRDIDGEKNIHAYLCRMVDFAAMTRIRTTRRYSAMLGRCADVVKRHERR